MIRSVSNKCTSGSPKSFIARLSAVPAVLAFAYLTDGQYGGRTATKYARKVKIRLKHKCERNKYFVCEPGKPGPENAITGEETLHETQVPGQNVKRNSPTKCLRYEKHKKGNVPRIRKISEDAPIIQNRTSITRK